jgi:4-amino-4-deoxy-L-arabinose transferase-like glycosyltransferase
VPAGALSPLRIWTAVLLVAGAFAVLTLHRDYGITWDEPVQARYGETVLAWFGAGFEGPVLLTAPNMRHYAPAFELLAALAYSGRPESRYEVRHALLGFTALLGALAVIRIGSLLGGLPAAVFASLVFVLLPGFFGHAFNNSKDVPFAVCFAWGVWALIRFTGEPCLRRALVCGLALGAALAVRPGGLPMLLALFVLAAGLSTSSGVRWRPLALWGAAAWALAWAVMVAPWPFALQDPLRHPLDAMAAAFSFPARFAVLFEGEITMSDALPRHYLVEYVAITTPPLVLALAVAGLVAAGAKQRRAPLAGESRALAVVELWLFAPLLLSLVLRPNVYDGMRHALFVLPALALLAGFGAAALLERAPPGLPRHGAAVVLLVACALPLRALVRLHPYQMTYFNAAVGGLAGASGRYETDYWLSSYKEAIEWVNRRAAERAGSPVRILVAIDGRAWDCAAHYLAPGVEMQEIPRVQPGGEIPAPFDYYVATTRYGADRAFSASPVAHRIGRDGATFTVIRARLGAAPDATP